MVQISKNALIAKKFDREVLPFSFGSSEEKFSDKMMQGVLGGFGGYGTESGTCCGRPPTGVCQCGIPKNEAIDYAQCANPDGTDCPGNWCCESCGTATWVDKCVVW